MSGVIEVFWRFLILGCTSFGGPVAHIGYFHQAFVQKQKWLSEAQFSQLLAMSQFLPGPASSQLGFALGLVRAGWLGALAAFVGFTLPSVLLLLVFVQALPLLTADVASLMIHGLKLVACAVVADAVLSMFKKLCTDLTTRAIAFIALCIVLSGSFAGVQLWAILFGAACGFGLIKKAPVAIEDCLPRTHSVSIAVMCLCIFLSLLAVSFWLPQQQGIVAVSGAFYQAGALVFGGGHVVLPLLEDAVVASGWLSSDTFLAGYGAAQAVPGPLFSVAAYLGAVIPTEYNMYVGASVALLGIFLPGFLLMIAVLPVWQRVSQWPAALAAITGVNAAVVGILAAALYHPIFTGAVNHLIDFGIVLVAFGLLVSGKCSILVVILWCVLASVISGLV